MYLELVESWHWPEEEVLRRSKHGELQCTADRRRDERNDIMGFYRYPRPFVCRS